MEHFLRIGIPVYFALFFGITFIAKSIIVARRIGKNPLVFPKDDSAYGLIGLYFKLTLVGLFLYSVLYAVFPEMYAQFLPIAALENQKLQLIGISILLVALIWTIIAQVHMKDSWRIGIDEETPTELITDGLFSFSRNPIFFGMVLSLMGLFLTTPNALTLLFLTLGYVLIQVQIRLEEEFLEKQHGENYLKYKAQVGRLIGTFAK